MLCIYKNKRAKGKIFCHRLSTTSALSTFVTPCQSVIAAHCFAVPEPGKTTVHGVEGEKHCHHEYSSDAALGFILRPFFCSQIEHFYFVKEFKYLKEYFKVKTPFFGQHTRCYANAKASSNHEMCKCVGLPSMRQSITQKKGCGRAEHSGILDGNRKVLFSMTKMAVCCYNMWFLTKRLQVEAA